MKYFVYNGNGLEPTTSKGYDKWMAEEWQFYKLPDYYTSIEDFVYSIETIYVGAIDKDEEAKPFIIQIFKDELVLSEQGVSREYRQDRTEYFNSFDDYYEYYQQLLKLPELVTF
jgi:hypothetical protein